MRRRKVRPGGMRWLPKAALKWVDGSGQKELVPLQRALYVDLGLGDEVVLWRERQFQALVIEYIDKRYPEIGPLCFHVPLELLRREKHSAGMFHALGARAGVADVVMLMPRGAYHGLTLELKVPPRRPTLTQCQFLGKAREAGFAACWVDSCNTALKLIDAYLSLPARATLAELTPPPEVHHEYRSRAKARAKAD